MIAHTIKNTTRGGQNFLHNLRMISQVLSKVLLWTLPFTLTHKLYLLHPDYIDEQLQSHFFPLCTLSPLLLNTSGEY